MRAVGTRASDGALNDLNMGDHDPFLRVKRLEYGPGRSITILGNPVPFPQDEEIFLEEFCVQSW